MPKIILVNGKKRSGKDYFCSMLKEELKKHGKTAEVMGLADPMKKIISTVFQITEDDLDTFKNNTEEYGFEIVVYPNNQPKRTLSYGNFREVLQKFGTEGMKPFFGDAVWANLLQERAKDVKADFILVSDFRFLVENISDITVKIRNDDIKSKDTHASENELNDFPFKYEIDNTGYRDISADVAEFVKKIL